MTKVLVTGSTQGIGRQTAMELIAHGHTVVLHARNSDSATSVLAEVPGAHAVITGDLGSLDETRELAAAADAIGPFDAVIHNAGVGGTPSREITVDGLERIFQVNVVAPYLLTALMLRPSRLVVLSSGLQSSGRIDFDDLQHSKGPWDGAQAYADSKLLDVVLAFGLARRWADVLTNAVDPGWIKTRMGGPHATGELDEGVRTPVWLATALDPAAMVSGALFKDRKQVSASEIAHDHDVQEELFEVCEKITGAPLVS